MNRNLLRVVALGSILVGAFSTSGQAQDVLAEHRINGLKDMRAAALVFRGSGERQSFTAKEWADLIELRLSRDAPDLSLASTAKASVWLELNVSGSELGAAYELSVYRWVKVQGTGDEIVATVWSQATYIFGYSSDDVAKRSLDKLLTRFAADYARARRRSRQSP